MRLSITTEKGEFFTLDVDPSMELENLRALVEVDTNIPIGSQLIYHNGKVVSGDKTSLQALGIKQDDILLVRSSSTSNVSSSSSSSSAAVPTTSSSAVDTQIEQMRQQLLNNPQALAQISSAQPEVAQAALNNPERFKQIMLPIVSGRYAQEMKKMQELAALENADPFDVEAQRKIEELIKQKNINENMEAAMEHNPEAFGSVVMLYIDIEVNGKHVKAFVDSGAQTTIMSPECAEYCGIMHLLDTRFQGMAVGVGTAKILGRIHATTLKLKSEKEGQKPMFLQCSITVMEGKGVDMLLGLDMLKRFQACIDLAQNVLRIGDFETPFLAEKDLPEKARKKAEAAEDPKPSLPPRKPPTTPASGVKHSEEHISSLMALGASREQAINALDAANGNLDVAAGIIFS